MNKEDLCGKKFGRLTVISFSHNKDWSNFWLCECDCGNEIIVKRSTLTRKKNATRSCGCLQKDIASKNGKNKQPKNSLAPGMAAFNKLYSVYKRNAKIRELPFTISKKEFMELTQLSCHYCGLQPENKMHIGNNGDYIYNGLDRKNSEDGYIIENVVPCCWECNSAKNNRSEIKFLNWINRVYDYQHGTKVL